MVDNGDGTASLTCPDGSSVTIQTVTPPTSPTVFAVAYSNVDGVDGYQAGGQDVWIARVIDSTGDGQVSIGDTIETNQYPLNYNATAFGNFQVRSHTITNVINAASDRLNLRAQTDPSWTFWFVHDQDEGERYYEKKVSVTQFWDQYGNGFESRQAILNSPSQPDAVAGQNPRIHPGDDIFIDVDIFI